MIDRIRQAQEHYNRGDEFDAAGDTARAIEEWERAVELDPNYFDAHFNLGITYADEGNLDLAVVELELAHALEPDDRDAQRELVRVLVERGEKLESSQKIQAAIDDGLRAVEIDSYNALAHFFLGQAYANQTDYLPAEEQLRQAIKNNSFFTDAYAQLADVYLAADRPRDAINILRQALNMFHLTSASRSSDQIVMLNDTPQIEHLPLNTTVSMLARKLAQLELENDDPDQAMAALEEAQPAKEDAELWRKIAVEFKARGEDESAEIASNRADEIEQGEPHELKMPNEEINPSEAEEHFARGEELFAVGNWDAAFEEYDKAIELNPDHADARYSLGLIYQKDEEYDMAEKEFREVLRINLNSAPAHFRLGEIFDERQDWENAAREYRESIRIAPDDQEARENLIWDLLEFNAPTDAQGELQRSELDALTSADLWNELGKVYEKRGSNANAAEAYRRALQSNKNLAEARAGLKRLNVKF